MFIDPTGKVIGRHEGEFQIEAMDRVLTAMVEEFDQSGVLNRNAVPFEYGSEAATHGTLSFPGKLIAGNDGRLYIADSNHHRIVVATDDGDVKDVIGNGESPLAVDSFDTPLGVLNPIGSTQSFDRPLFDNPQGMALDDEVLYVADAGTHTIQRVQLDAQSVSIIAGTGEQSLIRHDGGEATSFPLNSPYALELSNGILYIAMAGTHQLWQMDIDAEEINPFAGTGAENIVDGLRSEALLAQPYGLALDGNNLFFADSETSAIRVAKIGDGGRVVTLVGTGLFDFGDHDGIGKDAKLQHPQDVASAPGAVYIADTYNHKIKRMDLSTSPSHHSCGFRDTRARRWRRVGSAVRRAGGNRVPRWDRIRCRYEQSSDKKVRCRSANRRDYRVDIDLRKADSGESFIPRDISLSAPAQRQSSRLVSMGRGGLLQSP